MKLKHACPLFLRGSTAAITYSYDELGRTLGTSINGVSSSVAYDSLGRVTGATNALGSFSYGYAGVTPRLTSMSYPNGQSTTYSYQTGSTQDFRLTEIDNLNASSAVISKFDYTYNAVGTIATEQMQFDSNTPTLWTYGYDNADQLLSATQTNTSTSTVLAQDFYGYDPAGNRLTEQLGLSVTQTAYNNLNQITSASAGGPLLFTGTLSKPSQVTVAGSVATPGNYYSTNFAGLANVTTGTNSVPVVAHDVNGNTATNNYQVVVPSAASTSPTYDYNGNMLTSGNGQAYTWDAKNEMVSIVYTIGANSGNHTEFTYDGQGRRVAIVERTGTTVGSGTVTSTKQYVWIGNNIAEERDASNAVTKRFFPQGEQWVSGGTGTSYYYTSDHLGSVREMVDGSGTIQARYSYDAYGRQTKVSGLLDSTFQYTGDYYHAASGLNLTKYRAYDPNTGRWLSRDPIGIRGGINLYAYVQNGPIGAMDPLGLCGNCDAERKAVADAQQAVTEANGKLDAAEGARQTVLNLLSGDISQRAFMNSLLQQIDVNITFAERALGSASVKLLAAEAALEECEKNNPPGGPATAPSPSPAPSPIPPVPPILPVVEGGAETAEAAEILEALEIGGIILAF